MSAVLCLLRLTPLYEFPGRSPAEKRGIGCFCFGACWMGLASPGQGLAPLFWSLGPGLVLAFVGVDVLYQFTEGDRL